MENMNSVLKKSSLGGEVPPMIVALGLPNIFEHASICGFEP